VRKSHEFDFLDEELRRREIDLPPHAIDTVAKTCTCSSHRVYQIAYFLICQRTALHGI
jgi:hypothetical protein